MVQYLISYTFIYTRHWWSIYSKKKSTNIIYLRLLSFIYNILYPSLMVNMPVKDHSLWIPGSPLSDKTGDCFCRPSTFSGIRKGRSRASKSCVDFFRCRFTRDLRLPEITWDLGNCRHSVSIIWNWCAKRNAMHQASNQPLLRHSTSSQRKCAHELQALGNFKNGAIIDGK